jgi:phosphatidylserine decarboxylase
MPISGEVVRMEYRKGLYLNAMNPQSAERNEQSIITVRGEGIVVTFKQIAVWQDKKYIPCACTSTFCLYNH